MKDYKEIQLTQNQQTLVDNDDYEELMKYIWHAQKDKNIFYAVGRNKESRKSLRMHRLIMDCPQGMVVDHINHDTLDNRKENLRVVTKTQNNKNRSISKNNKSGYKGVCWSKRAKKWMASITNDGVQIHIGYFHCADEAYKAYCAESGRLHGEHGCTE